MEIKKRLRQAERETLPIIKAKKKRGKFWGIYTDRKEAEKIQARPDFGPYDELILVNIVETGPMKESEDPLIKELRELREVEAQLLEDLKNG